MGLDSFLYAEKTIYDWDSKDKELAEKLKEATGVNVCSFKSEIAYWRKANAIHKWFVDNVQEGVDDCREYDLVQNDLEELLSLVDRVLEDPEKLGPELLPTQDGFFFGGYDYGDWYVQNLESTKEQLSKVLQDNNLKGCYFRYQSSW